MRIITTEGSASISCSRECEAVKCHETTREGKPFCPEHVELNPHAHRVAQEIARREREDRCVARGETSVEQMNTSGITAAAIMQCLGEKGTRTKARICRELNIESAVLDGYVEALSRKNLVVVGTTIRGNETLTLRSSPSAQPSLCTRSIPQAPPASSQV